MPNAVAARTGMQLLNAATAVVATTVVTLFLGVAPAAAGIFTTTQRLPIKVSPYQVLQGTKLGIPTPAADGKFALGEDAAIVSMETDLVDADGTPVPIQRLMLHHVVFINIGFLGEGDVHHDTTCSRFKLLNSKTYWPAWGDRFYAAGEERSKLAFPPGYGYRIKKTDSWALVYMVMNHKKKVDNAFIQYKMTYATGADAAALKMAKMIWMDINNCKADPIYDVRGGGAKGSTDTRTYDFKMPEPGRLVSGIGHVHGGGKALRLSQPDCGDRELVHSLPTWGDRSHPFYNVKPILHEPGPINMTSFLSSDGLPVAQGQRLRLRSEYDGHYPHTRVMGIMGVYYVPDAGVTPAVACGALPELSYTGSAVAGRPDAPRFTVPLVRKPKGKLKKIRGNRVNVTGTFFNPGRILLNRGDTLRWKFNSGNNDFDLHNITLANGPDGFSSPHLNAGRVFKKKFTRPGRYQLFCGLHPVSMTEEIVVRKK